MKLYLDEMISPRVAEALRRRGHDVVAAIERSALGERDARHLARAIREGRVLVSHDVRDFTVLARAAAAAGRDHPGIVLVPSRCFPPADVGGLVRSLEALLESEPGDDGLRSRVVFLSATR